ncbi:nucleoside triphosphate pyrophosphohydrolase [Bacteroidota bacterium]
MKKELQAFGSLLEIMDQLREKCPWDSEQTIESLRTLTIEECYELTEAIIDNDMLGVKEELGDLLLHLVFYAKIGSENGDFDITDVIQTINKKLIFRHPHIFGDTKVKDSEEVKENWEKLKLLEGKKTVLSGVPSSLPALIKAYRLQDKARGIGFDWKEKSQVWEKVFEEVGELKKELSENSESERTEEEFGDVLFSLINAGRLYGINPENALEKTNKKFIKRFTFLENEISEKGLSLKEMSLEEMEVIWNKTKKLNL